LAVKKDSAIVVLVSFYITGACSTSSIGIKKHWAIMFGILFYLTKNSPLISKFSYKCFITSLGISNFIPNIVL
jgi:hypothetical protein